MMQAIGLYVLAASVTIGAPISRNPQGTQANEQIAWARGVLLDFFAAATESPSSALGLLTPDLAKAIQDDRGTAFQGLIYWRYAKPTITSEKLSPDGTEAVFTGVVNGESAIGARAATFKVRILTGNGHRWSIRYMVITETKGHP